MVLNVDEDVVFLCFGEKLLVVLKQLYCRLRDENMDSALNGVQSNWVVSGVWGEDGDFIMSAGFQHYWRNQLTGTALRESVNCGLIRIRVGLALLRELAERYV